MSSAQITHNTPFYRKRDILDDTDDTGPSHMDKLFAVLADFGDARVGGGDSFCDRLNCRYTVYILVIFAVMITTKHYVGEPIACWCPSEFTDAQVEYANKVCWVTNNYYLSRDQEIPRSDDVKQMISYYQWVGLLMICQAVMFYLPRPIWQIFNKKSGIAMTTITDAAIECQRKSDSESRDKTMRYMVKHMGRFLKDINRKHLMASDCKLLWWKFYGNFLIVFYLFMKLVYLANVIGQLFLLNIFLGTNHNYHMYGFEVIRRIANGQPISTSDRFPRVAFCDFYIRHLGNVNRYTIQCALPINLFNEKIYLFIWFWFVLVSVATVGSFLSWLFRCSCFGRQTHYIKTRLIAMEKLHRAPDDLVRSFTEQYLRRDGLFIIWMVAKNASDLLAAELISGLWEHYKDCKKSVERLSSWDEVDGVMVHRNNGNKLIKRHVIQGRSASANCNSGELEMGPERSVQLSVEEDTET